MCLKNILMISKSFWEIFCGCDDSVELSGCVLGFGCVCSCWPFLTNQSHYLSRIKGELLPDDSTSQCGTRPTPVSKLSRKYFITLLKVYVPSSFSPIDSLLDILLLLTSLPSFLLRCSCLDSSTVSLHAALTWKTNDTHLLRRSLWKLCESTLQRSPSQPLWPLIPVPQFDVSYVPPPRRLHVNKTPHNPPLLIVITHLFPSSVHCSHPVPSSLLFSVPSRSENSLSVVWNCCLYFRVSENRSWLRTDESKVEHFGKCASC